MNVNGSTIVSVRFNEKMYARMAIGSKITVTYEEIDTVHSGGKDCLLRYKIYL